MLIILKIRNKPASKNPSPVHLNSYKLLAETALFRGINKALLRIKTGINITSCTNNVYTLIKSRQINFKSKKVVTYFIAN
jgi:hypothetical protein